MSNKCEFQTVDEICTDGGCIPQHNQTCCMKCAIAGCSSRCDQSKAAGVTKPKPKQLECPNCHKALTLIATDAVSFSALTTEDGRVLEWTKDETRSEIRCLQCDHEFSGRELMNLRFPGGWISA